MVLTDKKEVMSAIQGGEGGKDRYQVVKVRALSCDPLSIYTAGRTYRNPAPRP